MKSIKCMGRQIDDFLCFMMTSNKRLSIIFQLYSSIEFVKVLHVISGAG